MTRGSDGPDYDWPSDGPDGPHWPIHPEPSVAFCGACGEARDTCECSANPTLEEPTDAPF